MIDSSIVTVYAAAANHQYGWLRSGSDSYAFIPELLDLRHRIIPAWQNGDDVAITERHASTLETLIDLFEDRALSRYRGTRSMQRRACTEHEPDLLKLITRARREVSSLPRRAH